MFYSAAATPHRLLGYPSTPSCTDCTLLCRRPRVVDWPCEGGGAGHGAGRGCCGPGCPARDRQLQSGNPGPGYPGILARADMRHIGDWWVQPAVRLPAEHHVAGGIQREGGAGWCWWPPSSPSHWSGGRGWGRARSYCQTQPGKTLTGQYQYIFLRKFNQNRSPIYYVRITSFSMVLKY